MALPRKRAGPAAPQVSTPLRQSPTREKLRGQTGLEGNKCSTFWRWRTTSFSGVSQRSRSPQRFRGPAEASALTSCVISTLLPTCRPTARFFALQLLDLTHRWWSEPENPDIGEGDVYSLGQLLTLALSCTPPGTQARLQSSSQTLGPALSLTSSRLLPLLWAGANLATSPHGLGCT